MFTYKNKSENVQHLAGVGTVEAGGTIEVDREIENPNFELVGGAPASPQPTPEAEVIETPVAESSDEEEEN